jgi:hypothetical protein
MPQSFVALKKPAPAQPRTLVDAYQEVGPTLIPQMQGTCGVFSFHYAARLLQALAAPDKVRPIDPPKKRYDATANKSIRSEAKRILHSAQGEIQTGKEMVKLVELYGYGAQLYRGPGPGRAFFINNQLAEQHPVLVAYWMGVNAPVIKDIEAGAHWSVIIGIDGDDYLVINPYYPRDLKHYDKANLLVSNANVDGISYARYWTKLRFQELDPYSKVAGKEATNITPSANPDRYDIARNGRKQQLACVLVAVS